MKTKNLIGIGTLLGLSILSNVANAGQVRPNDLYNGNSVTPSSSNVYFGNGYWLAPTTFAVTSLNNLLGIVTIAGAGGNTISTSGQTITITGTGTTPQATSTVLGTIELNTDLGNTATSPQVKGQYGIPESAATTSGTQYLNNGSGSLVPVVRSGLTSVKAVATTNTSITSGTTGPYTFASSGNSAVNTVYTLAGSSDANGNPYYAPSSNTGYWARIEGTGGSYSWAVTSTSPTTAGYASLGGSTTILYYQNYSNSSASAVAATSLATSTAAWSTGLGTSPAPTVTGVASSVSTTTDSYGLTAGDRVLLTAQATASQNGIWVYNGTSSNYTRPSDYLSGSAIQPGAYVECSGGSTYANSFWGLNGTAAITVDTTSTGWSFIAGSSTSAPRLSVVTAATYAVKPNIDVYLAANAASNNVVFTLPTYSTYNGPPITIGRIDSPGSYTVTITAATGTITGYSNVASQYQYHEYVPGTSGWYTLF